MKADKASMENGERLKAFEDLFLAGGRISSSVRNVAGFILANDGDNGSWAICKAYGVSDITVWRWMKEAVGSGVVLEGRGRDGRLSVDTSLLRKLASGDG